jgi:hypothetical protein
MAAILQEQGIVPEPDIIDFMAANPHCVYLFYQDGELMAFIRLDDKEVNPDLGRNTVEIHGAIMPAFKGQSDEPSRFVLEAAFKVKRNVIAKIAPDNLGAIGWCRRWGFRKINKEGGKTVYRLKRGEYQRLQA